MFNGNYRSVYHVIESLYRDEGYTQHFNISDLVEWVAEAMALIGATLAYKNKVTGQDELTPTIKIENYRGELPCDLHRVIQVREYCNQTPMRCTTDTFHKGYKDDRQYNFAGNSDLTYQLNDNYIFTSFEEGEVEMSYLAHPIDEKGYPMVPDEVKYIRAIKSYMRHKIDHRMWRQGLVTDKIKTDSEQEWYLDCKAADVEAKLRGFDFMESLKNQWLRLIPKTLNHGEGFVYSGQLEERYIK